MIHGTPRDANSLSPVPSAARPSRTARRMLFSFIWTALFSSRSLDDSLLAEALGLLGRDTAQGLEQGVGVLAQQGRTADRDG